MVQSETWSVIHLSKQTDIVAGGSDLKGTEHTDMVNNDKQKLLCLLKILWRRTDRQEEF